MRVQVSLIVSVVVFVIIGGGVSATTYYVDQNSVYGTCSDSYTTGENSLSQPWCTIARANDQHVGGDHVYILPGEYREKIDPKSGIDENQHTVYSGYGTREQVKILGSENVTGWTQCTAGDSNCTGIPSQNLQYIYYASFISDDTRYGCFSQPDPNLVCVPESTCPYAPWRCDVYATDCFEDRQRWFTNADLGYISGNPYYHIYPSEPSYVNESGKHYYDHVNSLVYVWPFSSDNPNSHTIECSKRVISGSTGNIYLGSYTTIQNLTIMHSLDHGIIMATNSRYFNILNNEIMYNSGSSTYAGNPSAIYKGLGGTLQPGIRIIGNKIHHQGSDKGPGTICEEGCGAGMTLYGVRDTIIADNEFYNNTQGMYVKARFQNVTTRNNIAHDTGGPCIEYGISEFSGTGSIVGNLMYNCKTQGIYTRGNNHDLAMYSNTIWNARDAITLEIHGGGVWPAGENFTIKNNMITKDSRAFITLWWNTINRQTSSNYNLFYDTQNCLGITDVGGIGGGDPSICYSNLSGWQTGIGHNYDNPSQILFGPGGLDLNSTYADPQFLSTDPASPDFLRPAPGSPAIDAGVVIPGYHCPVNDETDPNQVGCRHWSGTAPDIGFFEYTGPVCGATGSGTCYYVSTSGSDSNPGTFDEPFLTVQTGIDALGTPGDVLYIRGGTYVENVYRVGLTGTAQDKITISGYPGETAIIDGNYAGRTIDLNTNSYVVLENLISRNGDGVEIWIVDSDNVKVNNVEVYGTNSSCSGGDSMIHLRRSTEIIVENSKIHDNNVCPSPNSGEFNCGGIGMMGNYDTALGNIIIRNNVIYNMPVCTAIWDKHPGFGNIEIYNNTIYNVYVASIIRQKNTHFHHNRIYNITGLYSTQRIYDEDVPPRAIKNVLVEYNTFDTCRFDSIEYRYGLNITLRNNIYSECTAKTGEGRTYVICSYGCTLPADITEVDSDNNCIYYTPTNLEFLMHEGNYYTLTETRQQFGLDINSVFADPNFISTDLWSPDLLRPDPSSPCVNMGYYANVTGGPGPTCANVNGDSVINIIDLVLVVFHQGIDNLNPDWDDYDHLDINTDSVINFGDVNSVLTSFGQSC